MHQRARQCLIGAATLAALGCKPGDTVSTGKSLDNFTRASGPAAVNRCAGTFPVVAGVQTPGDYVRFENVSAGLEPVLTQSLTAALSAVPTQLQVLYIALGGKLVLSSNATKVCSAGLSPSDRTFASENGSVVESCWHIAAASAGAAGREADIYLLPTDATIRHATLRSFGFVLSQVLSHLDYTPGASTLLFGNEDPAFTRQKRAVGLALLTDVAASHNLDLKAYRKLLGTAVLAASDATRAQALDAAPGRDQYLHYAFAESFDSYYCNAATRSAMIATFPRTYAAFQPLAAGIAALANGAGAPTAAAGLLLDDGPTATGLGTGTAFNTATGTYGSQGLAAGQGAGATGNQGLAAAGVTGGNGGLFSGIGRALSGVGRFLFGGDGSGNLFNKIGRGLFGSSGGGNSSNNNAGNVPQPVSADGAVGGGGGGDGLLNGTGRFLFGGDGSGNLFNKIGRGLFGTWGGGDSGGPVAAAQEGG